MFFFFFEQHIKSKHLIGNGIDYHEMDTFDKLTVRLNLQAVHKKKKYIMFRQDHE